MEKIIIIIVVVVLLFVGIPMVNRGAFSRGGAGYQRISASEAKELMREHEDVVIVDVRSAAEFYSGHIGGAINVPVEEIGDSMPAELPDQEAMILLYCRSGARSAQAARKLASLGYTNVFDFGGINTWPGELTQ